MLTTISNYRQVTPRLASSGQPDEDERESGNLRWLVLSSSNACLTPTSERSLLEYP
jgi:hypothetical protein